MINKNGEIHWLEDFTSKIMYEGRLANLISLVDVTHKKEAEQLIVEENKRLLELQELRKDIITRVSHELKTPITSIYGSIQIILNIFEDELSEEVLNYINIGYRGCLRLKDLIENLLDVSRLDSKKMELQCSKEDVIELIKNYVADMNYLANKRTISIQVNLPDELYLNIDKLRFGQVITNVISNGIKNTQPKGNIYISLTDDDDQIEIKIKDTGVGLTQEEKSLLFQKFGKIERYGKDLDVDIEGAGLGLYI
ncbi:MAG: ATP-binding protein, partial [Promethearchaeota archaeon]